MKIKCNNCNKITEIDIVWDLDYLNPDMVDMGDNGIVFDFVVYCEHENEEGIECGQQFDINVPVNVTDEWVHVEQEECE